MECERAHMLFTAMEEEIRCHFHANKAQEMTGGCKGVITHSVFANDEVFFTGACSVIKLMMKMILNSFVTYG